MSTLTAASTTTTQDMIFWNLDHLTWSIEIYSQDLVQFFKESIATMNNDLLERFTLKAGRMCLRRLKDIPAFNFARYLDCEGDLN